MRAPISREPFEVAEDARDRASSCAARDADARREPEIVGAPFWVDSALLAAAGIPTVIFGPNGEGAHAEVEWVDLASLEQCVEIYARVAADLCS